MKINLDGNELSILPGETILEVATRQGIDIPTLCYRYENDCRHASTSCLVCLVKLRTNAGDRFVPACATRAEDGMIVESETDEVARMRKTSLELLLSDHSGDCFAPCQFGCPAGLDIPKMLREISSGNLSAAIRTIKENIPLPAILGRVCPKPCEKVCRRREVDSAVEICDLKRFVADADLAEAESFRPEIAPQTGKRVVVIGAGPSGLSAAYYLAKAGHRVSLYAQGKKPGGRLRLIDPVQLPDQVIESEIRTILSLPIEYYPGERLDWNNPRSLAEIREASDAVLLCTGPCDLMILKQSGFEIENDRLRVDPKTFTTSISGVFATGTIFRARTTMIVRSVADGRQAARSIDRFLHDGLPSYDDPPFSVRLGKLNSEELIAFVDARSNGRTNVKDSQDNGKEGFSLSSASRSERYHAADEASRCLNCDCRGRDDCLLLKHSKRYHADPRRFSDGTRPTFTVRRNGPVVFEAGKCIKCGLCISVSKTANEPIGLTFIGRGFDVHVAAPFDETLDRAIADSNEQAVRVCPTAALSLDISCDGA